MSASMPPGYDALPACPPHLQAKLYPEFLAPVTVKRYPGIQHASLLSDETAFNDVMGFILDVHRQGRQGSRQGWTEA